MALILIVKVQKLRIGKISYANLFPLFYTIERECCCSSYEFVEGVPSRLNKMLRNGEIDVSPSSSVEYLKNPSLYQIIDGHSISSTGHIGSILFFSKKKSIDKLNGSIVHVSSQSETSVALLYIILRKFFGLQCSLQISENPEDQGDAFLLIGDDALKYRAQNTEHRTHMVFDLGDVWHKNTGLPFVFALWTVRKGLFENHTGKVKLLNKFIEDIDRAKGIAIENFHKIVKHSSLRAFMSEDEIVSYWNKIDYDLTEEHKKGLELFRRYLRCIEGQILKYH